MRQGEILLGLVTSILLHFILFMGSNYWLRAFVPKPKQEISQEIPIEVVEVPPDETHIPPQTSLRATKDSIAGGKALPKRPVSAVKSGNPDADKAPRESPKDLTDSSPAEVFQPEREQQKATSLNISPQKPQPKPEQTAIALANTPPTPNPKKIIVALKTRQTAPAPANTPPAPEPEQTAPAPATTPSAPNPNKIVVAPLTTPPAQSRKTAIAPATTSPASNPKKLGQSRTRLSGRTPSQAQPSARTGAASLLGGSVSVSRENFRGDYLATLPNSNRDNQAPYGIDARSQDIDITSYLNQLQQRVKQQWLPGLSQSSRRTVLNFTVNRSGQLSNLQLAQTSGFSVTDKAALNAIQRAAPFAPLPTGYTSNDIHIRFTFDINVYGELNLSGDGG